MNEREEELLPPDDAPEEEKRDHGDKPLDEEEPESEKEKAELADALYFLASSGLATGRARRVLEKAKL